MKYLVAMTVVATLVACQPSEESGLNDVFYDHGEESYIVSPVLSINRAWQRHYQDSLLEVCRPKQAEHRKYFAMKAELDAVSNAAAIRRCQYANDVIDLMHRFEGVSVAKQQQVPGLCHAETYRGEQVRSLEGGLSAAGIYKLDRLLLSENAGYIPRLIEKAEEVFAFVEEPMQRAEIVRMTQRFGDEHAELMASLQTSNDALKTYANELIEAGMADIDCPTYALIDGDDLIERLPEESRDELTKKAVVMIQGRDAVNRGFGTPNDHDGNSGGPLWVYTYLIEAGEVIFEAINAVINERSVEAVKSPEYEAILDHIDRIHALEELTQASFNGFNLLSTESLERLANNAAKEDGKPVALALHEAISRHEIAEPYEVDEIAVVSAALAELPRVNRWRFEDNTYGGFSHAQILQAWEFFVACRESVEACEVRPTIGNRDTLSRLHSELKKVINSRKDEIKDAYYQASDIIKSRL